MSILYSVDSKSDGMLDIMRQLKDLLDPKGVLNPSKVLPEHPEPPHQNVLNSVKRSWYIK